MFHGFLYVYQAGSPFVKIPPCFTRSRQLQVLRRNPSDDCGRCVPRVFDPREHGVDPTWCGSVAHVLAHLSHISIHIYIYVYMIINMYVGVFLHTSVFIVIQSLLLLLFLLLLSHIIITYYYHVLSCLLIISSPKSFYPNLQG